MLTFAVASPLIMEGYIGHGNGLAFLLALALTSPLSLVFFLLDEVFFKDVNAFHMTGWPYLVTLLELGAGALLNAGLIYQIVVFLERKYHGGDGT